MGINQDNIRSSIISKLTELGFQDIQAVKAGKQNHVYTCLLHGETSIVKVTDVRHRSLEALQTQSDMLKALHLHSAAICAPIDIKDRLSIAELKIEELVFYVIAYTFAKGTTADIQNPDHVRLMGKSLALLHQALPGLKPYPFEEIQAQGQHASMSQVVQYIQNAKTIYSQATKHFESSDKQLLHGDFNAGNVKIKGEIVHIFDFDNCVYGSATYELANTLYMVLFDQVTKGALSVYNEFRKIFFGAYQAVSDKPIDVYCIDDLIGYRVLLLASWLAQPHAAPLFIRQSSQIWLDTLDDFVHTYFEKIRQ